MNEALSHRCPTSKPRKAAQPGEPGASPTVRARPGRGCSTFVRKGSLVQITFIGTASDVSRTWRKQADPATAPHDPPILSRCWCFNEALRGTASCLPPRTTHRPSSFSLPNRGLCRESRKITHKIKNEALMSRQTLAQGTHLKHMVLLLKNYSKTKGQTWLLGVSPDRYACSSSRSPASLHSAAKCMLPTAGPQAAPQ